jgi:hypothetical protein
VADKRQSVMSLMRYWNNTLLPNRPRAPVFDAEDIHEARQALADNKSDTEGESNNSRSTSPGGYQMQANMGSP